jgi:glutathione synthase/RimK-type ligase-like ATP-grasp enzyme
MPKFYFVNANVPEETVRLLRESCQQRDVEFFEIDAITFDYEPSHRAAPGDLLYCAGITTAAGFVEQHLYQPGVATFYSSAEGPLARKANPLLVFQRAGIPVPRWVHVTTGDRNLLRRYVERMGGFPVILKFPGFSRGIGVTRIDSLPSLFSIVDYTLSSSSSALLCAYVHPATHWRAVVVGDRVVSHYRNVTDQDDFRTSGSEQGEDYRVPAPSGLEEAAVAAVHALGHEFGGVDILEHSSGRLYVLESNNPCYFASGQLAIGTDVSGAMIEYLLQKSKSVTGDAEMVRFERHKVVENT